MGGRIVCAGMTCVDVIIRDVDLSTPFQGETKTAGELTCCVGGDAANEAIVLSRLGADVRVLSAIGDDSLGDLIVSTYRKAGVATDTLRIAPCLGSCMNVVVIHPSGQRNFINAGMSRCIDYDMPLEQLEGADILSLASILVPPFTSARRIARLAKAAKERGMLVCADVVCSPEGVSLADVAPALPYIDYIFPNWEEGVLLTEKNTPDEIAREFQRYGIKNVILKVGGDGCIAYSQDGRKWGIPAFPCQVLDTTGAGDNFAAGFLLALSEGRELDQCCLYAAATAAVSIQTVGANTGVKCRDQVEALMAANGYHPHR